MLPDVCVFQAPSSQGYSGPHPRSEVTVPSGYKLIGGGANIERVEPGNLLTASYPETSRTWVATGKDHGPASPAHIAAFAVGLYDPNDEWEVLIHAATSYPRAAHPYSVAQVPDGFTMTGGGAFVHWDGYGNLLTASYPQDGSTWRADSKDHDQPDPAVVTAYVIGLRHRAGTIVLEPPDIQSQTITGTQTREVPVGVRAGYTLTGGGAREDYGSGLGSGFGNLLTASYPLATAPPSGSSCPMIASSWVARGKDHIQASSGKLTAYAIGLKTNP
jgi:hypothetical protein